MNRGYYMATQRHEISLRVLKNISRVSAPFELFYKMLHKDVLSLLSVVSRVG